MEVELAWRIGVGEPIGPDDFDAAAEAYLGLVDVFELGWEPTSGRELPVIRAGCEGRPG